MSVVTDKKGCSSGIPDRKVWFVVFGSMELAGDLVKSSFNRIMLCMSESNVRRSQITDN